MYQFSYAEIVEDSPNQARGHERRAMERAIELLQAAQKKGRRSREAIEALHYLHRLWSVFLEDLASPENDLPEALRADLISIGLWVMTEAEAIRLEKSENFAGLIEISTIIADGLK